MSFIHVFIIGPDQKVALKLPERITPKQWGLLMANLELIKEAVVEPEQEPGGDWQRLEE